MKLVKNNARFYIDTNTMMLTDRKKEIPDHSVETHRDVAKAYLSKAFDRLAKVLAIFKRFV